MTKLAILIHSSTICFVTSEGTKSQKVVNYNAVWRKKNTWQKIEEKHQLRENYLFQNEIL
jgi:hypothetical protein